MAQASAGRVRSGNKGIQGPCFKTRRLAGTERTCYQCQLDILVYITGIALCQALKEKPFDALPAVETACLLSGRVRDRFLWQAPPLLSRHEKKAGTFFLACPSHRRADSIW